ncbi:MAG: EpsG family protein [Clostridia bacterium]|nr:EpsG family protein [Clostridia bacterium]
MAVYYVVFFVLFLCAFLESINVKYRKKYKNVFLSIFFIIFIILSTIYYGPGGDLYKYEWYFGVVEFEHLIDPIEPFENGYILLNALLRIFTSEYWVLRLVQALIVIGLWKAILLNRKDNFLEGREFIALLCLWALKQGNILIVRSSIAVVICIYGVKYIQSKEFKKFLMCMLIAFQFHSMVIIFLPAYWLYHKRNLRKNYILQ